MRKETKKTEIGDSEQHLASNPTLNLHGLTDNELLVLFVDRKCEKSFNELVRRHSRMVLGICRSIVSNQDCVEDAFQATFLAVIRNSKRLRHATSFSGWLCRVARNAAIKASKMQRSKECTSSTVEPVIELDPLNQLTAREVIQSLVEELEKTPNRYREVLILFYFEGLSRSEIASRMGCSDGVVKSLLQRGKQLLRTQLLRKGIVPALVILAIQAVCWQAYSCNLLIAQTTAICATACSSLAGVPPKLLNLSRTGDWKMLAFESVIAKSLLATVAIMITSIFSLVWSSGHANAQVTTEIVFEQPVEERTPPSFQTESQPIASVQDEAPDLKELGKMNPRELQAYQQTLESALKAIEQAGGVSAAKQRVSQIQSLIQHDSKASPSIGNHAPSKQGVDRSSSNSNSIDSARRKVEQFLKDDAFTELEKLGATQAGQVALFEAFVENSLRLDPTIRTLLSPSTDKQVMIGMQQDGLFVSTLSTTGSMPGTLLPNDNFNQDAQESIDKIFHIQKVLGMKKVEGVQLEKYPNINFSMVKNSITWDGKSITGEPIYSAKITSNNQ